MKDQNSSAGWSFPTFLCRKNGSRPLNSGCILIYFDGTGSPEVTAATASSIEDAGKALPLPSAAGHLVLGELGGEFIRPPGWSHCAWGCENQAEQRSRPLVWKEPCQNDTGNRVGTRELEQHNVSNSNHVQSITCLCSISAPVPRHSRTGAAGCTTLGRVGG